MPSINPDKRDTFAPTTLDIRDGAPVEYADTERNPPRGNVPFAADISRADVADDDYMLDANGNPFILDESPLA